VPRDNQGLGYNTKNSFKANGRHSLRNRSGRHDIIHEMGHCRNIVQLHHLWWPMAKLFRWTMKGKPLVA
jgi:hypothetical protein